jgi:L-amino acid N-acyltransferase YncA
MKVFGISGVREYLAGMLDHFSSLTSCDRYNRFFHTTSPEAIRDWLMSLETDQDCDHIFIVEEAEDYTILGLAQLAIYRENQVAELSVSVLPDFRRNGLATSLIQNLINIADAWKVKEIVASSEPENVSIAEMLSKKFKFSTKYSSEERCYKSSLKQEDFK